MKLPVLAASTPALGRCHRTTGAVLSRHNRRLPSCPLQISQPPPPSHFAFFSSATSLHSERPPPSPQPPNNNPDVLIVGSGAAGLSAALRCHRHNLRPLLIEKSSLLGGTTAWSGGGLWVPLNAQHAARGCEDSEDAALKYLEGLVGGKAGKASTPQRRLAYVRNARKVVRDLEAEDGLRWVATKGMPDYHGDIDGAVDVGRSIEPALFDKKKLGEWRGVMRGPSIFEGPAMHIFEGIAAARVMSVSGLAMLAKIVGRWMAWRVVGRDPIGMGQSLVAQLLLANVTRGTEIWRSTAMKRLSVGDDGAVTGAVVERDGEEVAVRARAVVLAAGGFAKNDEMRQRYHQPPTDASWSSVTAHDTGEVMQAGMAVGGATALMGEAWWNPTFLNPLTGQPWISFGERGRPGAIIVDAAGKRFMNEAESYNDAGRHMYERNKTVPAIPAWLIVDAGFTRRVPLMAIGPRFREKDGIRTNFLYKADSLEELSQKINVDTPGLLATVERFNGFATAGRDEDFGRGDTALDRTSGDAGVGPNPTLAPLLKKPFYAIRLYPGDIGTKGGLLTDEHARVLDEADRPIKGLYAAGNTSASVMGTRYAGAGATIGPAVVFGALAVDHAAGKPWDI